MGHGEAEASGIRVRVSADGLVPFELAGGP